MADQATLNQQQISKVRSAIRLNIYSSDSGTRTTINGNNFKIESPMTVPYNGQETPIGYISSEGSIYYDLIVEDGKVKARNIRTVVSRASYNKLNNGITAYGTSDANYRIVTPNGEIYNRTYSPISDSWSDSINRNQNVNNIEIYTKHREQTQNIMSIYDTWQYAPTEGRITFSLTVPDESILNVPQAPREADVIIEYKNKATGASLRPNETRRNQTIGSTVTVNPPSIEHFAPDNTVYTHTVVEGRNVITVYYTENAKIRPWAIRKSNSWKSLNTLRQWMKIRKSNNWTIEPNSEIYATEVNKDNFSPSRIRKGGKWKSQGKIGS